MPGQKEDASGATSACRYRARAGSQVTGDSPSLRATLSRCPRSEGPVRNCCASDRRRTTWPAAASATTTTAPIPTHAPAGRPLLPSSFCASATGEDEDSGASVVGDADTDAASLGEGLTGFAPGMAPLSLSTGAGLSPPAACRAQENPGGMVGDRAPEGPSVWRTERGSLSRRVVPGTCMAGSVFSPRLALCCSCPRADEIATGAVSEFAQSMCEQRASCGGNTTSDSSAMAAKNRRPSGDCRDVDQA